MNNRSFVQVANHSEQFCWLIKISLKHSQKYTLQRQTDFPGAEIILRLKNMGMFDIHPNLMPMLLLEPQLKLVILTIFLVSKLNELKTRSKKKKTVKPKEPMRKRCN